MNVDEMSRGELITLVRKHERNAARYNWLRRQHWNDGQMAVVRYPKNAVKLGAHCPSGEHLDKLIDEAMSNEG